MRPLSLALLPACLLATTLSAAPATGRVMKVLPHFLDLKGRHTLSPSLYERDAYQAFLRQHTNQISAGQFHIQWKAAGKPTTPLKLRVEVRGASRGDLPKQVVLEKPVERGGWFSHWTAIPLSRNDYKNLGEVTAWRVTLWEDSQLLGQQQSFLW